MDLRLGEGIGPLQFGMTELEVMVILGEPNVRKQGNDDEYQNIVYQHDKHKLTLTFYSDEDYRLAYIRTTNPTLTYMGQLVMDQKINTVFELLKADEKLWEAEHFFSFSSYFLEKDFLILHEEYGRVTNVEMGARRGGEHYEIIWPE